MMSVLLALRAVSVIQRFVCRYLSRHQSALHVCVFGFDVSYDSQSVSEDLNQLCKVVNAAAPPAVRTPA